MVRHVDAWGVEPVVNPSVREARRRRLIRMTKEQVATELVVRIVQSLTATTQEKHPGKQP